MVHRHMGVYVVAILMIVEQVLNLLIMWTNLTPYLPSFTPEYKGYSSVLSAVGSAAFLSETIMVALVNIVIGMSLLILRPWARVAAVVSEVLGAILSTGMGIFACLLIPNAVGTVIPALFLTFTFTPMVVIYLTEGSARDAFEHPNGADSK